MTSEHADHEFLIGRIVSGGEMIDDGVVAFEDDRIHFAGERRSFYAELGGDPVASGWTQSTRTTADSLLIPGLVDIHCHGAAGSDFSDGDEAGNRRASSHLHSSGTTTHLASTMALPHDQMLTAFHALEALADEDLIAGIHAEGPYLSQKRCGAQNPDYLRNPDEAGIQELLEAAAGNLLTMTYAPELPDSAVLVDILTTHGITPSIGHTNCDAETAETSLALIYEQMSSAGFDGYSGKPTVTHLFNGMPPMHHRSPGPLPVFFRHAAAGNAVVELISDGTHLHAETVRSTFELLGAAAIALVSDSTAATGLPDGAYSLGGAAVTVLKGQSILDATGSLAGGTASLLEVVRGAVAAGVALQDAVSSATSTPADVIGLADEVGALRTGLRADCLVLSPELELEAVVRSGMWLPRNSS